MPIFIGGKLVDAEAEVWGTETETEGVSEVEAVAEAIVVMYVKKRGEERRGAKIPEVVSFLKVSMLRGGV